MQDRSVTVVIPTYNNAGLLRECLLSLRDLDYPRDLLRVVVVDNASRDNTPESIATAGRSLNIKHVRLDTNTGFAPACNRGARETDTEWVAFLNDDAVAGPNWLNAMLEVASPDDGPLRQPSAQGKLMTDGRGWTSGAPVELQQPAANSQQPVCVASHIRSRDGSQAEYEGASVNLFGAGRPVSVWGWPDMPGPPGAGSPVLFASGGAMLIHRKTFLDVGGFDPQYFAYFEDVDLGWRLWVLGHRVAYAPDAVVKHIGGSTGKRSQSHKRYTLWECNSLATVLKNYETGNMERILTGALLLEYKRALMSAGDAIDPDVYRLTAPRENNPENVERLPRVSVAHIAAVDRFNRLLPHFMRERQRIQAARVRSDREILPLMGHLWQAQFAGTPYADAARDLFARLDLYGLATPAVPLRTLVVAPAGLDEGERVAALLAREADGPLVALVCLSHDGRGAGKDPQNGYTRHTLSPEDPTLQHLLGNTDSVVVLGGASELPALRTTEKPIAIVGRRDGASLARAREMQIEDADVLKAFCNEPRAASSVA